MPPHATSALPEAGGANLARSTRHNSPVRRSTKAANPMSKTAPEDGKSPPTEPSTKPNLLDPATFEAFSTATRKAVAEGLARRALMSQAPPSMARH